MQLMKVDDLLEKYILKHIEDQDPILTRIHGERNLRMVNGRMCSGPLQGSILTLLSKIIQPFRILEIGTYTGYSALCLVKGLTENGKLHTIEINEEYESIAAKYFTEAEMESKIIQHLGDADEVIPTLQETFDLVFLDADKREYLSNYNLFLPKVRIGGIIIADNTLWSGKVVDKKAREDEQTNAIMQFNDFVKEDPRVETFMLPIRDGMTILIKLKD
jgi:predicted O-methyltransferase YrrM